MFVIGFVAMIAAQWLGSLIKGNPFEIDWIYNIGMGLFIAAMGLIVPAKKRKENREKLKNSFKR